MDEREGGSLLAQTSSLSFSAITVGAACPVTTHSDALKLLERLNLPLLVYLRWLCHKTVTQPSVFWRSLISTTLLHLLPTQSPCLYANYSTSLGKPLTLSCPWPSELLSTPYLCPGYTAHVLRLRKELTPDSCCQSQRGISEDCPRQLILLHIGKCVGTHAMISVIIISIRTSRQWAGNDAQWQSTCLAIVTPNGLAST